MEARSTGKANLGSSFSQSIRSTALCTSGVPSTDFYVSDEWAVTKNIKLTYGLRFEKDSNPSCIETCFVVTNVPFTSSGYQGGASIPYSTTITDAVESRSTTSKAHHPQPRFGIAWKRLRQRQDRDPRRHRTVLDQFHRRPGRHLRQPDAEQVRARAG